MAEFRTVELFGGAMKAEVPSKYEDVSQIRQVPDHQEVYLDREGFASVTFDILERVGKSDEDALRHHFEDLTDADPRAKLLRTAETHFAKFADNTPAYSLTAVVPRDRRRGQGTQSIGLLVGLVRLVQQATDLVICVNVPDADLKGPPEEPSSVWLEAAQTVYRKVEQTLEVMDWGLFL